MSKTRNGRGISEYSLQGGSGGVGAAGSGTEEEDENDRFGNANKKTEQEQFNSGLKQAGPCRVA